MGREIRVFIELDGAGKSIAVTVVFSRLGCRRQRLLDQASGLHSFLTLDAVRRPRNSLQALMGDLLLAFLADSELGSCQSIESSVNQGEFLSVPPAGADSNELLVQQWHLILCGSVFGSGEHLMLTLPVAGDVRPFGEEAGTQTFQPDFSVATVSHDASVCAIGEPCEQRRLTS
jgi:hypothetical protein